MKQRSKKDCITKKPLIFRIKGLTAVELIIALSISVIVVAAAGFILLTQSGIIRFNRSVSTEQQRLNVAFSSVRYSLRMAGFDYGQGYFIQVGSVPAVQVVKASYPSNPYEVMVSYSTIVDGSNPCTLLPVPNAGSNSASSEFNLSSSCNIDNFYIGQILNITNPVPLGNSPLPSAPIIFCITSVQKNPNMIQVNPGKGGMCAANPVPPKNIGGGSVSSINQTLFYWGNAKYNFNSPYNVPGNLYECKVNPIVISPVIPTCIASTTIMLSDYINNFTVSTLPNQLNQYNQPYAYNISITGESNVALSDSPAYSVHVPFNSNKNGVNAKGDAGQIVGDNVLKVLNSNVFLRNVYYGK